MTESSVTLTTFRQLVGPPMQHMRMHSNPAPYAAWELCIARVKHPCRLQHVAGCGMEAVF
jgi:hypothetical protein